MRSVLCRPLRKFGPFWLTGADKRQRLVSAVLSRDEFADFWALKWADILLVDRDNLGDRGAYEFHHWLRRQFAENRPYDEWVAELITASGDSGVEGPVNFYRALRAPRSWRPPLARRFSVSAWSALSAITIRGSAGDGKISSGWPATSTDYSAARLATAANSCSMRGGAKQSCRTPTKLSPSALGSEPSADSETGDPRVSLARWLTSPQNPWFARLLANRLWKHFMGRGLVEPEDDLRSTNPATNEPLLAHLESQVVASRFDIKAVMQRIMTSDVYQLSSTANATNYDDRQNYSHYRKKRLSAESLLDAINAACGVEESLVGTPPGTRAIELWDNRLPSYFLEVFGRPERNSPCECVRSSQPTMAQALHLMNAPEIEAKLSDPRGRAARLIDRHATPTAIAEELCLATLGRLPGDKERLVAQRLFAAEPPRQAAEDFLWAMLNSYDFLFIR